MFSGRLNFSSGLTVESLTSTSGEIGDVDLVDLANNAWYYNEAAVITASLNFTDPVVMKVSLLFLFFFFSFKDLGLKTILTFIILLGYSPD